MRIVLQSQQRAAAGLREGRGTATPWHTPDLIEAPAPIPMGLNWPLSTSSELRARGLAWSARLTTWRLRSRVWKSPQSHYETYRRTQNTRGKPSWWFGWVRLKKTKAVTRFISECKTEASTSIMAGWKCKQHQRTHMQQLLLAPRPSGVCAGGWSNWAHPTNSGLVRAFEAPAGTPHTPPPPHPHPHSSDAAACAQPHSPAHCAPSQSTITRRERSARFERAAVFPATRGRWTDGAAACRFYWYAGEC